MDKPCTTRFFTQKGNVLDFEIQRGNYRLYGSLLIDSGIFKLEHCSFHILEAIKELRIVSQVAFT